MGPGLVVVLPLALSAVDDDPQTLRYVRDALARAGYAPIVTGARRRR